MLKYSIKPTGISITNTNFLSTNYGNRKTGTSYNSWAVPLVENEWDYSKMINISNSNPLPESFKNTFVRCGTELDIEDKNGGVVPFYTQTKYYYVDNSGNSTSSVNVTKVEQLKNNLILITSDKPYLVQTYATTSKYYRNNNVYDDQWDLYTKIVNPQVFDAGTNFYKVSTDGCDTDCAYLVVVYFADGYSSAANWSAGINKYKLHEELYDELNY